MEENKEIKKGFFIDEDGDFDPTRIIWAWAISSVPMFLSFTFIVSYLLTDKSNLFTWSTGILLAVNAIVAIMIASEQ